MHAKINNHFYYSLFENYYFQFNVATTVMQMNKPTSTLTLSLPILGGNDLLP